MNKTEWLVAVLFSLIGAVFAVIGVFLYIDTENFMKTAESTDAVIISIRTDYNHSNDSVDHNVFVEFEVDGKTYSGPLNEYHSGMYEGGTTTVYYNPNNPGDFKSSGSQFGSLMFTGMGILFFVIGCTMLVIKIKNGSKTKKLKETGTLVYAKIDEITLNRAYAVNGKNPYKLTASYLDPSTGKTLLFESGHIWFNIQAIVDANSIETVAVYFDSTNPKRYYIDVENLKSYIGN